jgi:hypothetical protein
VQQRQNGELMRRIASGPEKSPSSAVYAVQDSQLAKVGKLANSMDKKIDEIARQAHGTCPVK